jgi:hypothetical protein
MKMHVLIFVAALVVWHVFILAILWFLPLPARFERYKPAMMVAGVVVAGAIIVRHAGWL